MAQVLLKSEYKSLYLMNVCWLNDELLLQVMFIQEVINVTLLWMCMFKLRIRTVI